MRPDPNRQRTPQIPMKKAARATPRRKTSTRTARTSRVKRYLASDEAALREAVRVECLKQFERRIGRAWDAQLERFVRSGPARQRDQQDALAVHENLRAAIERTVEFSKRPREHAPPLGMGVWVPRFIQPLLEHEFLQKREAPAPEETCASGERHRLVAASNAVEFLGAGRRADATELAIVWLLGGGWPEKLPSSKSGLTPSQVIQLEARAFRAAARETRQSVHRPTYRARFEQDDAGHWSATVHADADRTVVARGKTLDEAHRSLREALALLLDGESETAARADSPPVKPAKRAARKRPNAKKRA